MNWEVGDECYVFLGSLCVSGRIVTISVGLAKVRLVTGHEVSRLLSEIQRESPRLQNAEDWPV